MSLNREDIIRMAREAGAMPIRGEPKQLAIVTNLMIERFAALIAAAEREACAKVCEDAKSLIWSLSDDAIKSAGNNVCDNLADAIRAHLVGGGE